MMSLNEMYMVCDFEDCMEHVYRVHNGLQLFHWAPFPPPPPLMRMMIETLDLICNQLT